MRSIRAALALVIAMALTAGACKKDASGSITYEAPFGIFSISISANGDISFAPGLPKLQGVLGTLEVEADVSVSPGNEDPSNGTIIEIIRTVDGVEKKDVYQVEKGHPISIDFGGNWHEDIGTNKVTITAKPGAESTISVSDDKAANASPAPLPTVNTQTWTGPWLASGNGMDIIVDSITRVGDRLTLVINTSRTGVGEVQGGVRSLGVKILDADGSAIGDDQSTAGQMNGTQWTADPQVGAMDNHNVVIVDTAMRRPSALRLVFDAKNWAAAGAGPITLDIPTPGNP